MAVPSPGYLPRFSYHRKRGPLWDRPHNSQGSDWMAVSYMHTLSQSRVSRGSDWPGLAAGLSWFPSGIVTREGRVQGSLRAGHWTPALPTFCPGWLSSCPGKAGAHREAEAQAWSLHGDTVELFVPQASWTLGETPPRENPVQK